MRKLYYLITVLTFFTLKVNAQCNTSAKGSVIIELDNSKNENQPVEAAYIILDKYNLTGAGLVKERFDVSDNKISLDNLPVGKYYADIYTKGDYKQHFSKVIKVTKKGKLYTFRLDDIEFYNSHEVNIPQESNDFSKTSVVRMK
jgi:hypothetical protein